MRKVLKTIYLEAEQVERLDAVQKRTRLTQSLIIREGIDYILDKYEEDQGNGKRKSKKG